MVVEVHPGDRVRLVHGGIHSWQRQGPLAEHFRDRQHESLRAPLRGEVPAVVQSATRVVGPSFWDEAELELLTLARRWRDRAWRDQTQLPRAQHRRVSWTLVLNEAPDFPEL